MNGQQTQTDVAPEETDLGTIDTLPSPVTPLSSDTEAMKDIKGTPNHKSTETLSVPANSKVPDPLNPNREDSVGYDRYFRISRDNPDLAEWSQSCVEYLEDLLEDLPKTELSAEEKCQILQGNILILTTTLKKWINVEHASS